MDVPKDSVDIMIEYFDGQDNEGQPYYVASSDELHFVTEGDTFEDLLRNIKECLQLCLEDTDSIATYGVRRDAAVRLVMDFPKNYAQTA